MIIYAVAYIENGTTILIPETVTTNLKQAQAAMLKFQSANENVQYFVATFEQTEKLTPPAVEWTKEVVKALAEAEVKP